MNVHKEQHLVGRRITVIYEITDPTLWRATNPLHYAHNGMVACRVSTGDLAARLDDLRCSDDADRINALEDALRSVLDWAPVPPDHWRAENQDAFLADMVKAREVLNA